MNILIPLDGSEPSFRALEFTAKLGPLAGANFTILVIHQYIVGRSKVTDVLSQEDVDALLTKSAAMAATLGLKQVATLEVKSRDVSHAIVSYAEENDIDLIIMGASGMGQIKSYIIGSVSAEVLRKSVCPVTIVH